MNFVSISYNDGQSLKEISVFVAKFDMFVMRLLELMDFLLEEEVVKIIMQLLLELDMIKKIKSL